jgi:hypothetical protein
MAKKIRKKRKVVEKDGKFYSARGVELTRASHTKTENEFIAHVLGSLRNGTKFWKPKMEKLAEGRRPNQSSNKRLKWENNCEQCKQWFPESSIQIDHVIPCGGISGDDWLDKIKEWIIKAYVEIDGYQRLCKQCHAEKTKKERGINDK